MTKIKVLLGKKVKELRNNAGYTQEKLAELANMEIASLSNIENGKNFPSNDTLEKLCAALKIQPFELFMFEYINNSQKLIDEMCERMKEDSNLTQKMYCFFQSVK